jgi:hypothetical protein
VREGKRIQVVAASLVAEGTVVARSTGLRLRRVELNGVEPNRYDLPDGKCPNPLPTTPRPVDEEPFPMAVPPGSRRAVEYLLEGRGGYFGDPTWVRLRVPVIAGEPVSPVARLAYTADLASGVGYPRHLPFTGINADISLNVIRPPEGEWLCLTGRSWVSPLGVGQVQAILSDTTGVAATVSMSRLVDPVAD